MLVRMRRSWNLPERLATPQQLLLDRRALLTGAAALAVSGCEAEAQRVTDDPTMALYPVKRNEAYKVSDKLTSEAAATRYNNFIELGSGKSTYRMADSLKIRPWTIEIDGLVEKAQTIDIDELIRSAKLEERVYRLRCVETWAAVIPWSGFPLSALIARARPLSSAKYLRFQSFHDPKMGLGQRSRLYPWPYVEGITMAEAMNELAFLATGAYGKPLPRQMGAPIRLALPWKYGFKSIKSIVKVSFVAERPVSLWENLQPEEYGFWANVNPAVPHVRWSQAREELLGTGEERKTELFNGYAAQVADLYKGLEKERLYT
jgi:sulfoxide reductase catalytic subunit YedY